MGGNRERGRAGALALVVCAVVGLIAWTLLPRSAAPEPPPPRRTLQAIAEPAPEPPAPEPPAPAAAASPVASSPAPVDSQAAPVTSVMAVDASAPSASITQTWDVEGRVLDPGGEPVAGAEVELGFVGVPTSTTTDLHGRYRTPYSNSTWGSPSVRIQASAPGFAPSDEVFAPLDRSRRAVTLPDVRLRAGHAVSGRVLYADGEPVEGAVVILQPRSRHSRERRRTATSQADGTFSLPDLPARGGYRLIVGKRGYPDRVLDEVAAPSTWEIRLRRVTRVVGVVRGLRPGWRPSVEAAGDGVRSPYVLVDAEGRFELDVEPGTVRLTAVDPDPALAYVDSRPPDFRAVLAGEETEALDPEAVASAPVLYARADVEAVEGEVVQVELTLRPPSSVRLEVSGGTTGRADLTLPGGERYGLKASEQHDPHAPPTVSTYRVAPGDYEALITVRSPFEAQQVARRPITVGTTDATVAFALPSGVVRGVVTSPNPYPFVWLQQEGLEARRIWTDEAGAFAFEHVADAPLQLVFRDRQAAAWRASLKLDGPGEDVSVTLEKKD